MNVNMKKFCAIVLVAASAGVMTARAQSYAWNGGTGSWDTDTQWTPNGVPGAGDAVTVAGGDITLPAAVTVSSLKLSGTVTLSGEAVTVSENANTSFSTAAGGTYTFNNKLVLQRSSTDAVSMAGTVNFKGGLDANTVSGDRLSVGGSGVIHISDVPAKMKVLILLAGTLHLDVADNLFTRLQLQGSTAILHVNVDNAWQRDKFDYFFTWAGAKMYQHGHDVYVSPWAILGGNADENSSGLINTDTAATFELQNTHGNSDIRTNSTVNLTGPLTFKQNANSTGTFALNRAIDSTGSLIVDGGVFDMTAKASWPNMASLQIGAKGKLRLAAGLAITVPVLKLDGSETEEPEGTYGATGSGATYIDDDHFEGTGLVRVLRQGGDPVTRVMVKDGAFSDASCWNPVGAPHEGDTLVLTGRTLRVDFASTVEKISLVGNCTLTGEELTLTGAAATAVDTANGGTYVFSNKVVYAKGVTTRLALRGKVYFAGGLTYPSYFAPDNDSEIHFQRVPVTTGKLTVFRSTVYIEVPSNSLGRVQAEYSTSHVHVLVDDPWLDSPWDYIYIVGGAQLYLHGHDVHVQNWAILGSVGTMLGFMTSEEPATFAVSQTHTEGDIRTNTCMDVAGQVTFKMDKGSTTRFVQNRPITTTAGVTVEAGTFEFTDKASATNALKIAVSGVSAQKKGRMIVNATKTFSRKASVSIGANGILELAAGTTNRVASLKVEDAAKPMGTYGATGSGAQYIDDVHFSGTGILNVGRRGLMVVCY